MDRERASFARRLQSLEAAFGRGVVPVAIPLGEEKGSWHRDLLANRADVYTDDGSGKFRAGGRARGVKADAQAALDAGGDGGGDQRRAHGGVLREGHASPTTTW
jgi:hypothetical protein